MKANKENILKVIFFVTMFIMLILPSTIVNAKSATYSVETVQDSLTDDNGEIIATISYEKPILEGESKEINLINQSIENDCKKIFDEYRDRLFSYAQIDYDNRTTYDIYYYCTYDCVVTNNDNGVISFKITSNWYAGGVSSTNYYGLTYSLETGKALSLADVVEGSSSEIKKRVVAASKNYMRKHSEIGWLNDELYNAQNIINNYEVSKYKYYLKGNKAFICFDTYELATGVFGAQIISIGTQDSPKINKTNATIVTGKTLTLKVSGVPSTVKWESSNKSIATVSSKGKVTAKKAGKATITAKVNGKSYSCKITVKK